MARTETRARWFRFRLVPTVMAAGMLAVLLALGVWQVQRLFWKQELISRLQTRSEAPPQPLPASGLDPARDEFKSVTVTGTFWHDREFRLVDRKVNGEPGLHILTPLQRSDGQGVVLVDRGWTPFENADPQTRLAGQTPGVVTVTGLLRFAKGPGWFTPDNETARNQWFFVDPSAMSAQVGTTLPAFYVVSGLRETPGGLPVGRQWRLDLPNDHLGYALTWFALAAGLVVVFLLFSRTGAGDSEGAAGDAPAATLAPSSPGARQRVDAPDGPDGPPDGGIR